MLGHFFFSKDWSIVPPCGHVRHYSMGFMIGLTIDKDISVLFHCYSMNFALVSTFPKAAVMNKKLYASDLSIAFVFSEWRHYPAAMFS